MIGPIQVPVMQFRSLIGPAIVRSVSKPSPVPTNYGLAGKGPDPLSLTGPPCRVGLSGPPKRRGVMHSRVTKRPKTPAAEAKAARGNTRTTTSSTAIRDVGQPVARIKGFAIRSPDHHIHLITGSGHAPGAGG
jgi:hypothetical protein